MKNNRVEFGDKGKRTRNYEIMPALNVVIGNIFILAKSRI